MPPSHELSRLQTDLLAQVTTSEDLATCAHAIEHLRRAEGAGAVAAVAAELRARSEFDLLPAGIQAALDPDPCYQTHHVERGLMHTVTTFRYPGASTEGIKQALLDMPWHWWTGGRVVGWTKRPDGSVQFVLWPIGLRLPASFGIELRPAVPATETASSGRTRPKLVIDSRLSGNLVGPGRYEIVPVPGGIVLRSVFDGVRRTGFMRLIPMPVMLQLHLRAERGVLPFPCPRGTGFVHIADRVPLQQAE